MTVRESRQEVRFTTRSGHTHLHEGYRGEKPVWSALGLPASGSCASKPVMNDSRSGLLLVLVNYVKPGQVTGREAQRSGSDVVGEMAGVACARDDQHVRPALQSPCQAYLRRSGVVLAGDR